MKLLRLHHDKAIKERLNLNLKKINNLLCVTNIKVTIKKVLFQWGFINSEDK